MANPKHYVVLEGLGAGKSDYTIQATGDIEKVGGRLGGLPVTTGPADQVSGSTADGTVWGKSDGYRIYGGIKSISLENPDHVQVHMGTIAGEPDDDHGDLCEVVVRAEKVEFISGQGPGEGALELEIEHDIRGAQSEHTSLRLPTGSTKNIGVAIDNFKVPRSGSEPKTIVTKITEREPPRDWFTGTPDEGSEPVDITLACDNPQQVTNTVPIDSDRGNPGKVKVYYTIDDLDD
ncbi:hypothetical protein DEQ92_12055 [Haloferax sp. Atlit-6N]|uniref:hypothetical protein n=1 Tax=Haloferax TaxID=2251 RepID=UPI0009DB60BB|nr:MULTISPECIES: hypothetical protein [Haloferax]REA03832.1 hypothetical protein DEQ92_12055 [Haloferax sp. Atlit-6N]